MKLLLDQNLSPRIVDRIRDDFPGSIHVRDVELSTSLDGTVWRFAKTNGYAIVTKDADFHQRILVFGHPPKVIWIQRGNCTTTTVIDLLLRHYGRITAFLEDADTGFLTIG
ncbi:MAG: hypothetical protein EA382_06195 [Spirochaetaceae bacterium]|nr:MAG: hypothetical protein EA382_06195 [Spirochaetaceae bacterium]